MGRDTLLMAGREMNVLNRELMPVVKELVAMGQTVRIPMHGRSMRPFIPAQGAVVCLDRVQAPLRNGEVLLVRKDKDKYVLHRLVRVRDGAVWLNGDALPELEGPFPLENVLARATSVAYGGRVFRLDKGGLMWLGWCWMRLRGLRTVLAALSRPLRNMVSTKNKERED